MNCNGLIISFSLDKKIIFFNRSIGRKFVKEQYSRGLVFPEKFTLNAFWDTVE